MASYTALDQQELAAVLARFNVLSLDGCEGVADGIENSTYMLSAGSQHWVLTVFEELSPKELPFFVNLMQWLFSLGLPVAHPLSDRDGVALQQLSGKPALLFPRLPGRHLRTVDAAACAAIGQCLGRLHEQARHFPHQHANPRGLAWMAASQQRLNGRLSPDQQTMLDQQLTHARTLREQGLPTGIIHADLFRDNALFTQDATGAHHLSGIIDFYSACTDILLLDLAITVNDWCGQADGSLDLAKTASLVGAYHAERPITTAEARCWQATLQLAACRFWLSRLLDETLPRHAGVQHAHKPSAEYWSRLQYHTTTTTPLP